MNLNGSWAVVYRDGSTLSQYDTTSPHCVQEAGEVPYRKIDWPEVTTLILASQILEQHFPITPVPPEFKTSLRSRTFKTMTGEQVTCFMVVVSKDDEDVTPENTSSVFYWFPDGTVHECVHFDCPDVGHFGALFAHDVERSLMPATHAIETSVDGIAE